MRNPRDLIGGALIGAVGLMFLAASFDLRIGTPRQMGPGYFPVVLSVTMIAIAVWIIISSWKDVTTVPKIHWRPLLAVAGSIAVFAVGSLSLGLVPGIFLAAVVAVLGDDAPTFRRLVFLPALLSVIAWLVFRVGLGLQLAAFRGL